MANQQFERDPVRFTIVAFDQRGEILFTLPGWSSLERQIIRADALIEHDGETREARVYQCDSDGRLAHNAAPVYSVVVPWEPG